MNSLQQTLDDVAHRAELYIFGPAWGYAQRYYLGQYLWASPFVVVTLFWGFNWIVGTGFALAHRTPPLPGQPDLRFQPRKSLKSVFKLTIWSIALGAAALLKYSHITGAWVPAGVIELGVLMTELIYLLRNLGRIAKAFGNMEQSTVLGLVADSTEEFMDSRIKKHTEVTMTETITTTTAEKKEEVE